MQQDTRTQRLKLSDQVLTAEKPTRCTAPKSKVTIHPFLLCMSAMLDLHTV